MGQDRKTGQGSSWHRLTLREKFIALSISHLGFRGNSRAVEVGRWHCKPFTFSEIAKPVSLQTASSKYPSTIPVSAKQRWKMEAIETCDVMLYTKIVLLMQWAS
ncbi:uncharacterized protein LOC115983821 [Quercus lobata]|uniref:uncharacterized protein LOC115983821 n=1 Tax=Quercus lobata TaxID=97700 RepID=UPI001246A784|nr:uncharacterized protein LOC115983821 [Quercus lobata]